MGRQSVPPLPSSCQVWCVGCRMILSVGPGMVEFISPTCQLPPELMHFNQPSPAPQPPPVPGPPPPPPGLPPPPPLLSLPPVQTHGIDPTKIQLPCAHCKAILNVPHGLSRFNCPQCGIDLTVDVSKLKQFIGPPEEVNEVKCQICSLSTPKADTCPFSYTPCHIPGCWGSRRLRIAKKPPNVNRKFLKCQYADCDGFQWLDVAILHKSSTVGSSTSSKNTYGCTQCGDVGHCISQCPWTHSPCIRKDCNAIKTVLTSGAQRSDGRKFLKCHKCEDFEWIYDVVARMYKNKVKGPEKMSQAFMDEFCVAFASHITMPSKKGNDV